MEIQIVLAVVFVYLYGAGLRWLERPRRPRPQLNPNERDWMQDFAAWMIRRPLDGDVLPPQRRFSVSPDKRR